MDFVFLWKLAAFWSAMMLLAVVGSAVYVYMK